MVDGVGGGRGSGEKGGVGVAFGDPGGVTEGAGDEVRCGPAGGGAGSKSGRSDFWEIGEARSPEGRLGVDGRRGYGRRVAGRDGTAAKLGGSEVAAESEPEFGRSVQRGGADEGRGRRRRRRAGHRNGDLTRNKKKRKSAAGDGVAAGRERVQLC